MSAGPGTGANCWRQLITWIVFTLAQAACFLGGGRQGWERSARSGCLQNSGDRRVLPSVQPPPGPVF